MEVIFASIAGFLLIPFVFYAVLIALFLLIALNIDGDRGDGWGWATIGSLGLGYVFATNFGITFDQIVSSPSTVAIALGAYIMTGIAWSFGKWYFKLSNVRDTYQELKARFIDDRNLKADFFHAPIDEALATSKEDRQQRDAHIELNASFVRHITDRMRSYANKLTTKDVVLDPTKIGQVIAPAAAQHKSSITQWIMFWPISFVWTIINDPVRKIANYIFSRIKNTFQRMSDAMFAGV